MINSRTWSWLEKKHQARRQYQGTDASFTRHCKGFNGWKSSIIY